MGPKSIENAFIRDKRTHKDREEGPVKAKVGREWSATAQL